MFNSNLVLNDFKKKFESSIFKRGVEYIDNNRIKKIETFQTEETKLKIIGKISGSNDYNASMFFDFKNNKFDGLNCDCPYYSNCKHLVALGIGFIHAFEKFLIEKANDNSYGAFEKITNELATKNNTPCANNVNAMNNARKNFIQKQEKFNPENFQIVINCDLNINIYKNSRNRREAIQPDQILKKYSEISQDQKAVFKFLEKFDDWQFREKIDYEKFFNLIKKSKLKIFKQKRHTNWWNTQFQELFFTETIKKIKAKLILNEQYNEYYKQTQHTFIFKLDEDYAIKKNWQQGSQLFCKNNHLICIAQNNIYIHKVPIHLLKIISRIELDENFYYEYNRNDFLQTQLLEHEIIDVNKIINDGKKFLDLETNITTNFNVQKFNGITPCVIVDFKATEESLVIKPAIDYGFYYQDVSETIFYSKSKYRHTFKRREFKNQNKYIIKINDKNISYAPLEIKKEIELFKSFYNEKQSGFSKTLKCKYNGEKQIFNFFKNNWQYLKKIADENNYAIKFINDEFNFIEESFSADFNVDLNAENDLLWFDVNCYGGKDKINIEDLKKYVENKKEFIKINDGRLLKITNFEELERFIIMLESFYAREQGGFEGKLYHAPELQNVFTSSKYYNAKVQESFNKFIEEAKSGKPVEEVKLNPKFNKIVRSYQKEGIDWFYFLRKYRFAGILADDMGLGKTLQALILIEMEKKKDKPSIVVCPKSILYNWKLEAKKFVPNLKTMVIDGSPEERKEMIKNAKKNDLIITGYATMKKDAEIYEKEKINFNYCILDEAQFIKNHTTKNARIIKKINADYRLALTGTPLENNVSEIWSIFDFLMPGFLKSYNFFVKRFQNPIMKFNNNAALEQLRKKIECFMLRRTKDKVLKELPPKNEQTSHCHLEKAQNILYQEVLANVKSEIFKTVKEKGFNKASIHILAGLTKLRQICNHPALLLKNKDYTQYESAKLDMFMELIDEIIENKRKVLVFSQFTQMLDILAEELKKNKISFNYLSGKTKNRQELVDNFNNDSNKQIFLISLKAGGTGLNLTSADNVIIFDPWWNPSVENQAIDRAHRIGQKNSVNVYRLITLGTIEEKIIALQKRKKFLFDNLIGESNNLFQKLTWEDVKGLFE
ncbi:MAG: DEAD/DEAH box helicase [Patescibacteria group bacterium]